MSNQVNVSFKVTGGDLSTYIDSIKAKSQSLTQEAIKGALAQSEAGKQQLAVINQQIAATERKARIEAAAARAIALEQRQTALSAVSDTYEAKKNKVFADTTLSEKAKKEKITALTGLEAEATQKVKSDYNDQLTVLREQERQQKIQTQLSREQIDSIRQTARENVRTIQSGDKKLEDVISNASTDEERLIANLTAETISKGKKEEVQEKQSQSLLSSLLTVDLMKSIGGMASGIPNAKNELDFVKPIMSTLGLALGGTIGSLIDMAEGTKVLGTGLGQTSAGLIGAELGKEIGEFMGASLERSYKNREELTRRNFALQALTGVNYGVDAFGNYGLGATGRSRITGNLSPYGVDYLETSALQYQLATKQGNGRNLLGGAENIIALERGLGVQRETLMSVIEMQRSASQENRNFTKTIAGVLQAGEKNIFSGDRTFLGEFLGKFTTLQRDLLKTNATVATGTTMQLMTQFSSLGGPFDAKDPRSLGLLQSYNNALINPATSFQKALQFQILRNKMPGANIADIIEEQQKGAASKILGPGLMEAYSHFGSDVAQRAAFATLFNGSFVNGRLARNGYRDGKLNLIGGTFDKELSGGMSEDEIRQLAKDQTGKYTQSTAEISNAFTDDVAKAVKDVGTKMTVLFGDMMTQLEDYITKRINGGLKTNTSPSGNHGASGSW